MQPIIIFKTPNLEVNYHTFNDYTVKQIFESTIFEALFLFHSEN